MNPIQISQNLRCQILLTFVLFLWAVICQSQPTLKWPDISRYSEGWKFTPDGEKIFLGNWNHPIKRIWSLHTGYLSTFDSECPYGDPGIEFQPNGGLALTGSHRMHSIGVRIWDIDSGKIKYKLKGYYGEFSPDGNLILMESTKGDSTMIRDANTGKLIYALKGTFSEFSQDGRWIFNEVSIQGSENDKINIFETKTGSLYRTYVINMFDNFIVSGDSKYLIVLADNEIKVIDIALDNQVSSLILGDYGWDYPQISPDNKWIMNLHLLNFNKNKWIITQPSLADKKKRLRGWKGESKLFQLSTGKLIKTIPWCCCNCPYSGDPEPPRIIFSPDGKYFCIYLNCKRKGIFESETGKLLFKIKYDWRDYWFEDIKFSYDGNWIANLDRFGRTQIWDIKTGELIWDIDGLLSDFHPELPLILVKKLGKCSIMSLTSGKILISFNYIGINDWIVVHPSGLFDVSPGAMEKLYFEQDEEIIEFDSLKYKYYEPGLWEKVMSVKPPRAIEN